MTEYNGTYLLYQLTNVSTTASTTASCTCRDIRQMTSQMGNYGKGNVQGGRVPLVVVSTGVCIHIFLLMKNGYFTECRRSSANKGHKTHAWFGQWFFTVTEIASGHLSCVKWVRQSVHIWWEGLRVKRAEITLSNTWVTWRWNYAINWVLMILMKIFLQWPFPLHSF